jgi:hypothetical protein
MEADLTDPQWNDALEQVVKKEAEQAECLYWLHNKAAGWAQVRNDAIQIPVIVLSTVTGFFSATTDLVPPLALGGVSICVGILGTLNSYFKFSQRSENHRMISLLYLGLYKTIEIELALPITQRTDAATLLKDLRQSMKQIAEQSPPIPDSIVKLFKHNFKDNSTSRPIIANGLDAIRIFKTQVRTPTSSPTPIIINA